MWSEMATSDKFGDLGGEAKLAPLLAYYVFATPPLTVSVLHARNFCMAAAIGHVGKWRRSMFIGVCSTYRRTWKHSTLEFSAALSELVLLARVIELELFGIRVGDGLELLELELHQRVVALH